MAFGLDAIVPTSPECGGQTMRAPRRIFPDRTPVSGSETIFQHWSISFWSQQSRGLATHILPKTNDNPDSCSARDLHPGLAVKDYRTPLAHDETSRHRHAFLLLNCLIDPELITSQWDLPPIEISNSTLGKRSRPAPGNPITWRFISSLGLCKVSVY
jgi:hypothetical protein